MGYGYQPTISFGPKLTPRTKLLIILNAGAYLLLTIDRSTQTGWMDQWLSLIPAAVTLHYEVWRLVTYMFLHGADLLHIMFNMLMLWMFGSEVELRLGSGRFLRYYFLTGIGAGFCSLLVGPFSENYIMGASGSIYAIILAFALFFPNRYLLLFFVIPVKARYLALGTICLEAYFSLASLAGREDGIAHIAHLGGVVIGYLLLRGRTILPDLRYWYLRGKANWLRRRFKVVPPAEDRWRKNRRWMN